MSGEHKNMAMGEGMKGADKGPMAHPGIHDMNHAENQDAGGEVHRQVNADAERSGPPPISTGEKRLHAQAHSDHGPHHIGNKHRPLPA
jgi:hypothetical protein